MNTNVRNIVVQITYINVIMMIKNVMQEYGMRRKEVEDSGMIIFNAIKKKRMDASAVYILGCIPMEHYGRVR